MLEEVTFSEEDEEEAEVDADAETAAAADADMGASPPASILLRFIWLRRNAPIQAQDV